MTPLHIRQAATEYEKANPDVSPHEAFIQGFLFSQSAPIKPIVATSNKQVVFAETLNDDDMFLFAWNLYDRKDNKKSAQKAWRKLSQKDKEKVISVIPAYVRAHEEKKFRPMFATFLNQERFNDEEYVTDNTISEQEFTKEALKNIFGES